MATASVPRKDKTKQKKQDSAADASKAASKLNAALSNSDSDERKRVLTNALVKPWSERQRILEAYDAKYNKSLESDVKSALENERGPTKDLFVSLSCNPIREDATHIHSALIRNDFGALSVTFGNRKHSLLQEISKEYEQLHKKSLLKAIEDKGELPAQLKQILTSLLTCTEPVPTTKDAVKRYLKKAKSSSSDHELDFNDLCQLLCQSQDSHIRAVYHELKKSVPPLDDMIKDLTKSCPPARSLLLSIMWRAVLPTDIGMRFQHFSKDDEHIDTRRRRGLRAVLHIFNYMEEACKQSKLVLRNGWKSLLEAYERYENNLKELVTARGADGRYYTDLNLLLALDAAYQ